MKKTLAVLLTLALALCMMPSVAFAATTITESNTTIEGFADAGQTVTYDATKSYDMTIKSVQVDGQLLTAETDYGITYQKNGANLEDGVQTNVKEVGTYTATIEGRGNYTGTIIKTLIIREVVDPARGTIMLKNEFTSSDIDPTDKTKLKSDVLNANVYIMQDGNDVTSSYENFTSKITGNSVRVTVQLKGDATKTRFADFTIKTNLEDGYEIVSIPEQTYTGKAIEPTITVRAKGSSYGYLTKGTHYTVAYTNNVNAGSSALVTVTGIGTYTGTLSGQFTIGQKPITSSGISITVADAVYQDGKAIAPEVIATDGTKTLKQGTDYAVTCSNTAVGTATAVITGINNYKGQVSKTFNIVDKGKELSPVNTWVYVGNSNYSYSTYYNGRPQTPAVTVLHGATQQTATILSSSYYNVTYIGNDKAGQAEIIITGKNGYAGSVKAYFTILPTQMTQSNTKIGGYNSSYPYTGMPITPTVSVAVNGYTLTMGKHYTVEYSNNRNISTTYSKGKITIRAIEGSGYTGVVEATFTIAGKSISGCSATFTDGRSSSAYTGRAISPKVTVRDGYYSTLVEGVDYTISYKDAAGKTVTSLIDAGTYTVTLTGRGNYSGTLNLTYTITGIDISKYTVTLRETSVKADGANKVPVITGVTYGTTSRLSASDYTVSYQDASGKTVYSMSSPGTYKVVVTGKGGYSGSASATFRIVGTPQDIKIAKTAYKVYPTSDSFRISATATGDGTGFSYVSNNPAVASVDANGNVTIHKIGRAVITVTTTGMKKSDPASDEVYVKVYPVKSVLSQKPWNVSGKKGSIKVRWNKQEEVTKYQIKYCQNSKFTAGTYLTKTVNNSNLPYDTQSTSLTKLKSGKKYYIKVRAIKEVYNEKGTKITYYGTWSNWRSVVVK